jgi:hypothetical protein
MHQLKAKEKEEETFHTTAELFIAARLSVTGKKKPVTSNISSDG